MHAMDAMQPDATGETASLPAALRGHIDKMEAAGRFARITGWVCQADNSPASDPISVTLAGVVASGFHLNFRGDLLESQIASGLAAFDVICPVADLPRDAACAVLLTDAAGRMVTLDCPAERIGPFTPEGAFDWADADGIGGWVFNPLPDAQSRPTRLLLDGEPFALVHTDIERHDLMFDMGDGHRLFGFQLRLDEPAIARFLQARRFRDRDLVLSLACGRHFVANRRVQVSDSGLASLPDSAWVTPPHGFLASDFLEQRLFG